MKLITKPVKKKYWEKFNTLLYNQPSRYPMEEQKEMSSFIEKLKQKTGSQQSYGGKADPRAAGMDVTDCPNCGARRARQDGITHCVYCGFEFLAIQLGNGLHLGENDNSQQQ